MNCLGCMFIHQNLTSPLPLLCLYMAPLSLKACNIMNVGWYFNFLGSSKGVNISTQKVDHSRTTSEIFSQGDFYNIPERSFLNDITSNFNFLKTPSLLFKPIYALRITQYSHFNPLPLPLGLKVAPNSQLIELICKLLSQFLFLLVFFINKIQKFFQNFWFG